MHIEGHRFEVKGRRQASQQEVKGGDPLQGWFQDCTVEQGGVERRGEGRVRRGGMRWIGRKGGTRDLLYKLEDLESGGVVLAADCREERGVAFSVTAAQLEVEGGEYA